MFERFGSLGRWVRERQAAVSLSRPVGYGDVLRYLFWRGLPALAGPAVVLAGQVALNGLQGLVLVGGGLAMFLAAVLAATARVGGRTWHAVGFAAAGGAVALGTCSVLAGVSERGVAGWVVGFFAFTAIVVVGAAHVTVTRELE